MEANQREEEMEVPKGSFSDALPCPRAMVVQVFDAHVTLVAVLRILRSWYIAFDTN